jgi:hypothetical protein
MMSGHGDDLMWRALQKQRRLCHDRARMLTRLLFVLQRGIMRFRYCVVLSVFATSLAARNPAAGQAVMQADTSACPSAPVRPDSQRAAADTTRAPRDTSARSAPSGRRPSIVLLASASSREVRFASQPRIHVRLCGGIMDSVRVLERRNLPDPVRPGATYRDVYVAVEILGHLNTECILNRLGVTPQRTAGARAGRSESDPCATLTVRDSAGATRNPPQRPPE